MAEKLVARYAAAHPDAVAVDLPDQSPDRPRSPYHRDVGWGVADPSQVPALVEDMLAWGVSTLKIYDGTERPVGRSVIEEGHRHGLRVMGHLGRYALLDAVADGIDGVEHIQSAGGVFEYVFPPGVRRPLPPKRSRN